MLTTARVKTKEHKDAIPDVACVDRSPSQHQHLHGRWAYKVCPQWLLWHAQKVSSLADIEQVIQSSSVVNECQLVGSQTGEMIVPVRDWASFLAPHFRELTGIKKFHHFHFSTSFPGVVKLQQHSDSPEEERSLLKDPNWKPVATDLPPIIQPTGLSFERKQYLFEKIREFCWEDTRDLVCPNASQAPVPPDTPTPVTPPSREPPPSLEEEALRAKRRKIHD